MLKGTLAHRTFGNKGWGWASFLLNTAKTLRTLVVTLLRSMSVRLWGVVPRAQTIQPEKTLLSRLPNTASSPRFLRCVLHAVCVVHWFVFLIQFQGEDLERSQEESLQALHDLRSDGHASRLDPPESASVIEVNDRAIGFNSSVNPYAGLYSDALPDASQQLQSPLQHTNSEALLENDSRRTPSRGSDILSESQSVADEVGSHEFGSENFADEGF